VPSVAVRRLRTALAALLVVAGLGCEAGGRPGEDGPAILLVFDGSREDADVVFGPPLAGLELAADEGGAVVASVNVEGSGGAEELLAALEEEPTVIGAVVVPWTRPPTGAAEVLARRGVAVVSLSWAWGPAPGVAWRSLALDRADEAELLVAGAERSGGAGPACISGEGDALGRSLEEAVREAAPRSGADVRPAGEVDPERPATASAVAGRVRALACDAVVWTGGPEAGRALARATAPIPIVGTSRFKNDDTLAWARARSSVETVCGCADVTLTRRLALERFVHDVQADSASPPGPYTVEAYDAGRLLLQLHRAGAGAQRIARAMASLDRFPGLVGTYRFRADGTLVTTVTEETHWRAAGSRWLPVGAAPA
jgi:ABC-type branched-subunit amino acid transport system substrate-binding protein